jgi:hypothetical protein
MDERLLKRIQDFQNPLCKFGPGGDYVTAWPDVPVLSAPQEDQLSKVLETLAGIIGVSSPARPSYQQSKYPVIKYRQEWLKREHQLSNPTYPAPAPAFKIDSCKPDPSGLFSNDQGNGVATSDKQNDRFRASRRTARKRSHTGIAQQGSLFETYTARAKTA